ncbi:hypothetical protein B0H16DRAFT_1660942 [Mycena metata]|uniref:Uncharacterized protein n=1 Tax=Mycena metata TaxID=1033252 RepID=A0AAD7JS58_9AGAR|nr:hypothetical protein B0H16DRAFT_1660942 [Mycena metata]
MLTSDEARDEFFAKHGVRWTEISCLTYFDIVRWTVIDPMHNLLLGLAKTQWYHQWIQSGALRADTTVKFRELHLIHEFLETAYLTYFMQFESPLWAGRLPLRVGEPAGGSLTADEYKFAVTAPWAMIIPIVWDHSLPLAVQDHTAALSRYPKRKREWAEKMRKNPKQANPPPEPKQPVQRMQDGEDINFLRFATALKIMVGSSIRLDRLPRLYGSESMKPNHHWAVHIPDEIHDFGRLYSFWAFLTERLNKILKNLNSNNWTGGRVEVSMMREFHRSTKLDAVADEDCARQH